jgi:hypothetical protein
VDSDDPKILSWEGGVKEEICLPEVPHFLAKVADLRLYYCILDENAKNLTSGRNIQFGSPLIPSKQAFVGLKIYGYALQGLKLPFDNLWA